MDYQPYKKNEIYYSIITKYSFVRFFSLSPLLFLPFPLPSLSLLFPNIAQLHSDLSFPALQLEPQISESQEVTGHRQDAPGSKGGQQRRKES